MKRGTLTSASAKTMFSIPPPSSCTATTAMMIIGSAANASTMRIRPSPSRPLEANRPSGTPISSEASVPISASGRSRCADSIVREKTSNPIESVPNGCDALGACMIALGSGRSGSCGSGMTSDASRRAVSTASPRAMPTLGERPRRVLVLRGAAAAGTAVADDKRTLSPFPHSGG